jgi:hypothetical protein
MPVFSLMVGIALILAGVSGFAQCSIPDEFLALLGLSQALCIGGLRSFPG